MSLDKGTKEEITKKFQLHEKDTGSADVQIAILTERITELTEHLKRSPKDHASRLALLKLVGQRRRLLDYLNSTDTKRYQSLIAKLKLRRQFQLSQAKGRASELWPFLYMGEEKTGRRNQKPLLEFVYFIFEACFLNSTSHFLSYF